MVHFTADKHWFYSLHRNTIYNVCNLTIYLQQKREESRRDIPMKSTRTYLVLLCIEVRKYNDIYNKTTSHYLRIAALIYGL